MGAREEANLMVPVSSPPREWNNATNNLQTAVALAAFGLQLRESAYRGSLDPVLLENLASQAMETMEEDDLIRQEALQLVLDTLPLIQREEASSE